MNILLIYLNEFWSPPFYLEKVLKKKFQVDIFDFANSPYWGDLRFKLPFYYFGVKVSSTLLGGQMKFDIFLGTGKVRFLERKNSLNL